MNFKNLSDKQNPQPQNPSAEQQGVLEEQTHHTKPEESRERDEERKEDLTTLPSSRYQRDTE